VPAERPVLLIVSGPAGSGKTTLCEGLRGAFPGVQRAVTATTRAPRPGEAHGRDYYFLSAEAFAEREAAGDFIETAKVHGRRYGTLRAEIEDKLDRGIDLLLNIDVQGAAAYREAAARDARLAGRLATVFVMPPSLEELERRMSARGEGDAAEVARRLETARAEMVQWDRFDYCIRSASREEDLAGLTAIFRAEKLRVPRAGGS